MRARYPPFSRTLCLHTPLRVYSGRTSRLSRSCAMKPLLLAGVLLSSLALPLVLIDKPDAAPAPDVKATLAKLRTSRGICVVLGDAPAALELARASELLVYVQTPDAKQVEATRRAADAAGLLGTRV